MNIPFYKYQGTGNDFIVIDQRENKYLTADNHEVINHLCDRRFGIGADGLIALENSDISDFKMVYYNADGYGVSMCGNGGRCIIRFAHNLGLIGDHCTFEAIDGMHEGRVEQALIYLKMSDIERVDMDGSAYVMDTGSPHYVVEVDDLDGVNVMEEGKKIRYSDKYAPGGLNVNFICSGDNGISVATYERGVEGETLSCGTGAVACAVAYYQYKKGKVNVPVSINSKGGHIMVDFQEKDNRFSDVWLIGPAEEVFKGEVFIR